MSIQRWLIDDARLVLRHAWSVRLSAASAVLSMLGTVGDVLPYLGGLLPPKVMGALAAASAVGALAARFVPQRKIRSARNG